MGSRTPASPVHRRLAGFQREWDRFGRANPMWAVCTGQRDRQWDTASFLATGVREIDDLIAYLDQRAVGLRRDAVLDFGCGVGRLTQPLSRHFIEAIGVDVAPSMVDTARRLDAAGRCAFVVNDRPDLAAFADASFDVIYSTMVFQHLTPDLTTGYVREFRRVLRPGGAVVFTMTSEPAPTWRGRLWRWLPRPIINRYKRWHDGSGALMEMHGITRPAMEAILAMSGFMVEDVCESDIGRPDWLAFRYLACPV